METAQKKKRTSKAKRENPFLKMLTEQREAAATIKAGKPLSAAQQARLVQPI